VDLLVGGGEKKGENSCPEHFHFFLPLIIPSMLHSYLQLAESTIGPSEVTVSTDIPTPPHYYKSNICVE
jgi:hypothetical protein